MVKLIMMVGLPGAGKSTASKEISIRENAVILSSDALKEELLHGVIDKKYDPFVFNELYSRAQKNIKNGISVILDATNVASQTRRDALKKYEDCEKNCYFINTPVEICLKRNSQRDRVVPEAEIINMYNNLEIPSKDEGFDNVYVWNQNDDLIAFKEK